MNDLAVLESDVLPLIATAQATPVMDTTTYGLAGDFLLTIKAHRRKIEAAFGPIITKAWQAHKEAVAQRKKLDDPLDQAERIIKGKMVMFQEAEHARRRQIEAEAQATIKAQLEAVQVAEAAALEQAGRPQEAETVLNTPIIPPPVMLPPVAKVAGTSFRTTWTFVVENVDLVPREYLAVDTVKIGQVVRAMKGLTNIPGIRAFSEQGMAVKL